MKKIMVFVLVALFIIQNHLLQAFAYTTDGSNVQKCEITHSLPDNSNFVARKYVLGPNDVISISFLDMPDLNETNIKIQPDGKILLAPEGELKLSGLTVEQARQLIIKNYKTYIKNPQISIKLIEVRPFIVYVTGAVLNPGSYELNTTTNTYQISSLKPETYIERKTPLLSNILVAAGGLSYDADLEHVLVINKNDNSKFEVNLMDLLENSNSNQDVYLISGDNVYVPKLPTPLAVDEEKYKKFASATFSPHSIPVKVYGYVNTPGLIRLDSTQSLNLNSAIVAAGGYLKDSAYAPNRVYISRADVSGKLVTKAVDPRSNDPILLPDDIVYVPEKPRPLVGKAFDYASRIITPALLFSSAYNSWAQMFNPTRYVQTVP